MKEGEPQQESKSEQPPPYEEKSDAPPRATPSSLPPIKEPEKSKELSVEELKKSKKKPELPPKPPGIHRQVSIQSKLSDSSEMSGEEIHALQVVKEEKLWEQFDPKEHIEKKILYKLSRENVGEDHSDFNWYLYNKFNFKIYSSDTEQLSHIINSLYLAILRGNEIVRGNIFTGINNNPEILEYMETNNILSGAEIFQKMEKYYKNLDKLILYVNNIIDKIHVGNFSEFKNFDVQQSHTRLIYLKILNNMRWIIINNIIGQMINKYKNGAKIYITDIFESTLTDLLDIHREIDDDGYFNSRSILKSNNFTSKNHFNYEVDMIMTGFVKQFILYYKPKPSLPPAFLALEKAQKFFSKEILTSIIGILMILVIIVFIVIGTSKFISMMRNKNNKILTPLI